ncbi:MAG: bifunctional methylenetetrahydrofolate dehydrogenase/methenyltetrahydrofolate cyclohydrolase, partial [Candidatus Omnitrophica bacterium]|nr:bifunctional methylenetetrahydrofolate dehydrogenase/methenyltetrahydrofolate cyclohydrolase [Candidatus Omnitrophota bacterium]
MSAQVLDGKILAAKIKDSLRSEVEKLKKEFNKVPTMVNIVIGDDHGTCAYAKSQEKVAEYIGINYELKTVTEDVGQEQLEALVRDLNSDADVNGILIHKPVPEHIDYGSVANHIDIIK